MSATRLQVEYLSEPLAIATKRPRFSWLRDAEQDAYELELLAADGSPIAASGRVESDESHLVEFAHPDLESGRDYLWRLRLWSSGDAGEWAESSFGTGLFDAADWQASWVEPVAAPTVVERWTLFDWIRGLRPESTVAERLHPPQLLRQEFELPGAPVRARLYATAHGIYAAELNGSPIGDEVLAPGFDSYLHRTSVQTYDVTALLQRGANVLGVALADGWWAGRIGLSGSSAQFGDRTSALWQLHVSTDAGDVVIASDGTVVARPGPWSYADLFIGERFDARSVEPGWSSPAGDGAAWTPVAVAGSDASTLVPFAGEPVRRIRELPGLTVVPDPEGGWIVDIGQVIAGRVRITLRGAESGDEITLEHTETLAAAGAWFVNIDGINKDQTDVYVAAGRAVETWEPTFTFHGFRYVRVRGLRSKPRAEDILAVVLASDLRATGELELSDARLQRLHDNVVWSQRGNFFSVPTDCPQRERAGWTGEAQVFAAAAASNAVVAPFLGRWLANLRADQMPDGRIPIISPWSPYDAESTANGQGIGAIVSAAGWSDAIALVPWTLYERTGDRRLLEENYDAALAWVDYLHVMTERTPGFGDWLAPSTLEGKPFHEGVGIAPELTSDLMAQMYEARTLDVVASMATVLGRPEVSGLTARAAAVRAAFEAENVGVDGSLPVELQGPYVVALAFGMVAPERRPQLVEHLVRLVHARGDRLDTGFLSVQFLLDVLWENGHADLARKLLWQDEAPSWLAEVDRGATTIWESWDAVAADGTPRAVSLNHYAFGCVDDVLYRRVAGIRAASPGYRDVVIEPDFAIGLVSVQGSLDTPYGRVHVDWEIAEGEIAIACRIPRGIRATLNVPSGAVPVPEGHSMMTFPADPIESGR
jgi:alpha-L-rhamnosidase